MQPPQRVLPVIEYEKATSSPWPAVLRMMGIIGIVLGALLILNAAITVLTEGRFWLRHFSWEALAELLVLLQCLLLLVGSIGCCCRQSWGRVLLLIWAWTAPVAYACLFSFQILRDAGIPELGKGLLAYVCLESWEGWLELLLFPLMILVLLRPGGNYRKLALADPTAAAPPLRKMIRAISILGLAMALSTCIYLADACWLYFHHLWFNGNPAWWTITYFFLEPPIGLMLILTSIACWRLRPSGRWLFIVYSVLWAIYQIILPLSQFQGSGYSVRMILQLANNIAEILPFPLVIILLMFRGQIRMTFVPRPDEQFS